MTVAAKRQAWRFGRRAEVLALLWLRLKGYRILKRNLRLPVGEVDIVARRGHTVAFIEVKARPRLTEAAHAVAPRQRTRIVRAAAGYLAGQPALRNLDSRFDALLLAPWRLPVHIEDAWQADEGKW